MSLTDKLDEVFPFSFDLRVKGRYSVEAVLDKYFAYRYNRDKQIFEILDTLDEGAKYRKEKTFYEELRDNEELTILSATEAELGPGVLGTYDPRSNIIRLLYSLASDEARRVRDHELRHYERTTQGLRLYDRAREEHETRKETNTGYI